MRVLWVAAVSSGAGGRLKGGGGPGWPDPVRVPVGVPVRGKPPQTEGGGNFGREWELSARLSIRRSQMKSILSTTSVVAALIAVPAFAQTAVVTETTPTVTEVQSDPATTGAGAAGGATSGAIAGAVVGGPVGAAVGAIAGAVVGDVSEDALTPETRTYVMENKTESVVIDGDLVVGTQLPEAVQIQTIPESPYSYVYVQDRPVLIEPESRKVVHIYE